MNALRKYLGIVWMMIGPAAAIFLVLTALKYITQSAKGDIGNPVPWMIIIAIFIPIAIGITLFGYYAWKGEYKRQE